MNVYIYILKDPINGEIRYCGKTNNIKERFRSHLKLYKNSKEKIEWIKYLKNKNLIPVIEIIDEVDINNWEFWEKYWISQLKQWGFNLLNKTNGGEHNKLGFRHSKESKEKISKYQKGRKLNKEWKENISAGKKGIRFSEDHIKNLSLSHKGKRNENNKTPIYQIDKNTLEILNKFDFIIDALKYLNVDLKSGSISRVCKGKLISTYGYYWCYVSDYNNYKYEKHNLHKLKNKKNIYQYDKYGNFISKYNTIKEASIKNNIDGFSISHVLNGDGLTCKNYIWLFEENIHTLNDIINKVKKDYIILQIKNDKVVKIYKNIKEAKDSTNISKIGEVINGYRKTAGGYIWKKFYNDFNIFIKSGSGCASDLSLR